MRTSNILLVVARHQWIAFRLYLKRRKPFVCDHQQGEHRLFTSVCIYQIKYAETLCFGLVKRRTLNFLWCFKKGQFSCNISQPNACFSCAWSHNYMYMPDKQKNKGSIETYNFLKVNIRNTLPVKGVHSLH